MFQHLQIIIWRQQQVMDWELDIKKEDMKDRKKLILKFENNRLIKRQLENN